MRNGNRTGRAIRNRHRNPGQSGRLKKKERRRRGVNPERGIAARSGLPTSEVAKLADGQTAFHSADEAEVARKTSGGGGLDLRAEVRWHSSDRGEEWDEGKLGFPE